MKLMLVTASAVAMIATSATVASARDQIRIVGSSTVFPYTQAVAEEVAYYMVLIVLMVMLMDSLSGWLRRKLIKGE